MVRQKESKCLIHVVCLSVGLLNYDPRIEGICQDQMERTNFPLFPSTVVHPTNRVGTLGYDLV